MVAVTTYTSNGGPVSTAQADANFTNLNTGKVEEALSFPSIRPSLMLDFVNGQTLDPRITFTRASTATFVGSNGLIQTAAANVPRFDFDPVTLACKGWLLEPAKTNVLLYSEQFDNAAWYKASASVVSNWTTAPDGATTADFFVATANGGSLQQSPSGANIGTTSIYVKSAGARYFSIYQGNGAGYGCVVTFDLQTGLYVSASSTWHPVFSTVTPGIISVGNGWYRCSLYNTGDGGQSVYFLCSTTQPTILGYSVTGFTSDGYSGVYLWGAQRESGSFATSYIPTAGSQVTRAAETGVMTGVNFTSWYNYGEGTQYVEARSDFVIPGLIGFISAGLGPEFYSNNQVNTWVFSYYRQTGTGLTANMQLSVQGDGAAYGGSGTGMGSTVSGVANNYNDNTKFQKAASALKPGDSAFYWNTGYGTGSVTNSVSAPMPRPTTLGFATNAFLYAGFSGHIKKFEYYPRRLTNAQLQALTTI